MKPKETQQKSEWCQRKDIKKNNRKMNGESTQTVVNESKNKESR